MKQGGDDLGDDFVVDDLVAFSGDEDAAFDDGVLSDSRDAISGEEDGGDRSPPTANTGTERKRKRREKEKDQKKPKLADNVELIEHSIAAQSPNVLSDYLTSMLAKSFPKMSALELHDMQIPRTSIADSTVWTGSRTLDHLVEFIVKVLPTLHTRLCQKSKANGSPTLLFVTGAALRVVDVARVLKDKKLRGEKGGEVAKLFARHFKIADHVAYLRRTKVGVAVGTPGRIGKLLCETDALTVSALSHIMLDVTYQDAKKRSLLDIPETRDEVFKTVFGGSLVRKDNINAKSLSGWS